MKYIDISLTINKELPLWPGSRKIMIRRTMSIKKNDQANVSWIGMDVHTGTHIDAPKHFINNGIAVDEICLDKLIGNCYVCDLGNRKCIDADFLESVHLPAGIDRIIFKTKNSKLWNDKKFNKDFVALTPCGAEWIIRKGICLVGIDYLSIQNFQEQNNKTHKILLEKEVVVIEGLILDKVKEGIYKLIALPIKINNSDGSPVRAVLEILS